MPGGTPTYDSEARTVAFSDVDLNATGTTTIYDPGAQSVVYGAYMAHEGSTAEYQLEVTDGTDTATLDNLGAGESMQFDGQFVLSAAESLQINVTVAEGAALSETAAVSRTERE